MIRLLKNRRGLSEVITTLIILVVSILLATVVVYFAVNVVGTRVQEEALNLSRQHIWANATGVQGTPSYTLASVMIVNTGGRDVVLDEIDVRGQNCPWNQSTDPTNQKFLLYCTLNSSISPDLGYVYNFNCSNSAGNTEVLGGVQYNFTVPSNKLILKSGNAMLVYIVNPDSISVPDVGLTTSITIHSAQAVYIKETNIQAVASS